MSKALVALFVLVSWAPLAAAQTATPEATPSPVATATAEPTETPVKAKGPKGRPSPEVSGAIQLLYKERVDKDGDGEVEPSLFRVQRIKIRIEGDLSEKLSYQLQFDPRSPLITNILRDAYIEYEVFPNQKLRAGQMKTPFGYENWTSSSDLFTTNRTEVSELHGRGITQRDIGVGLVGHVPIGENFRIENAMSITNGAGMGAQADDDNKKNYFGKLNGRFRDKTRDFTLWLGASGGIGTMNEEGLVTVRNHFAPLAPADPGEHNDFKRVGVDLEIDSKFVFFVVEGARGWEKNVNDPLLDPEAGETEVLDGWYVLTAIKTPWQIGPVVRFDSFGVMDEPAEFERWTLGIYYGEGKRGRVNGKRPLGEELRLMATYEFIEEDGAPKDDRAILWAQVEF